MNWSGFARGLAVMWVGCLGLVLAASSAAAWGQDEDGFKSIFDGKTMEGWDGLKDYWSVEDGALTGQFTAENNLPNNTFLIWRGGQVGDFHLKLKFRMQEGNSGIQYRSQEFDNFVVGGYQADMDFGKQWIGILYDERGRGILATQMQKVKIAADGEKVVEALEGDKQAFLDGYNPQEWNSYEIIARGNQVKHVINGVTTIEVHDDQKDAADAEGILAFQLHTGPPMKVQYKDVLLKVLK